MALENYYSKKILYLRKYLNKKDIEALKKLNIYIKDIVYTAYEFDVVKTKFWEYYYSKKNKEENEGKKSLEGTGVKRRQYNKILKKFDKLDEKFIYNKQI